MIMQTAQDPNNMNSNAHDLKNSFRVRHILVLPPPLSASSMEWAGKSRPLCGAETAKLGKEGIVLAAWLLAVKRRRLRPWWLLRLAQAQGSIRYREMRLAVLARDSEEQGRWPASRYNQRAPST
jgi:hypothetical protein